MDIFAGDNFHPPFPSKLRNLAIYLKGRPLLRQPDLNISILTADISGCEGFEKVVEGSSTHHMNRDASNVLTLDIVEPPINFWQGPDNGKGPDIGFVLDLGCIKTISGVSLVNDPSVGGATKRFRLRGSFLRDGNGDILLEQSLELESTPIFQQFSFEKPAVVRYVKFELLDFWASAGSKGGLEYFRPYSPTAKNTRGEQLCLFLWREIQASFSVWFPPTPSSDGFFSHGACNDLGNGYKQSVEGCKESCRLKPGCDAINYYDGSGSLAAKICKLQQCSHSYPDVATVGSE